MEVEGSLVCDGARVILLGNNMPVMCAAGRVVDASDRSGTERDDETDVEGAVGEDTQLLRYRDVMKACSLN